MNSFVGTYGMTKLYNVPPLVNGRLTLDVKPRFLLQDAPGPTLCITNLTKTEKLIHSTTPTAESSVGHAANALSDPVLVDGD